MIVLRLLQTPVFIININIIISIIIIIIIIIIITNYKVYFIIILWIMLVSDWNHIYMGLLLHTQILGYLYYDSVCLSHV